MQKPAEIFDRDYEWSALTRFNGDEQPRATLGVVSGRRHQGKTFLLDAACRAAGGFYFGAIEATDAESRCPRRTARAYPHAMNTDGSDLPKVSAPALRALTAAGYTRLEHLTEVTESELLKLHGMGPKAVRILRDALAERNLSFRSE